MALLPHETLRTASQGQSCERSRSWTPRACQAPRPPGSVAEGAVPTRTQRPAWVQAVSEAFPKQTTVGHHSEGVSTEDIGQMREGNWREEDGPQEDFAGPGVGRGGRTGWSSGEKRGQGQTLGVGGTLERDPGCGQVPGEAARALPTRQTQVRCVCLLSKPPSGLRNERPWWWKGKLGTFQKQKAGGR